MTAAVDSTQTVGFKSGLKAKAIRKIAAKAGCSEDLAAGALDFIGQLLERCRQSKDRFTPLTDDELASSAYKVMDVVMHHGLTSTPGSAHAAIESALLEQDEGYLIHEQREDDDPNSPTYCALQLLLTLD